jgi:anti-sigma B factor antagonist
MHKGSVATVGISGSIDVYTASTVGQTIQSLIEDGFKDVMLDLSAVKRLDSSGLGTLVGNAKSIASNGGRIWLVGVSYRIRKMLEVTSLARYFEIRDGAGAGLNENEPIEVSHTSS